MLWGVGKGGGGSFMITGHTMKNTSGCGGGGGRERWWEIYDNWTHQEECFGVWGREVVEAL